MYETGKGELILVKPPSSNSKKTAVDFLPCEFCFNLYSKDTLNQHCVKCLFAPDNALDINYKESGRALLAKFLNIPEVKPSNTPYGNLLATMVDTKHNPGIKEICTKDPLIKLFAESLLDRFGPKGEQRVNDMGHIRGKIRCIARLVKTLNANTGDKTKHDLEYYICGRRFKQVTDAVKQLTMESNSPAVAISLGHILKV